jgi:cytochrome d ubiquinol oxidase subunit II
VVVLFVGFPTIFNTLMIALHLPMLALLVGIVVRGAAFTFRHYDAIQDARSQRVYTWLFGLSSLWTAFWLGIIVASLNRGIIDLTPDNAWDAYVAPWWGLYPLSVGCFVACIFVFLACVYLIGETSDAALKRRFVRHAAAANVAVVIAGALVFVASLRERDNLFTAFLAHPVRIAVIALATLLFIALWTFIRKSRTYLTRTVAAGQVTLILTGWYLLYAPNALITAQRPLSFHTDAAPAGTLVQLLLALAVGSLLIFPSLFFLLRVFKTGHEPANTR